MGAERNICRSCGTILQPTGICPDCTITDFKLEDTLTESLGDSGLALAEEVELGIRAILVDESGQQEYPVIGRKCKIGRDPTNQIVLQEDKYTSRFHVWITYEDGHFFVEDMGSTNGTLLNGSPLINRRPLVNGDYLRIGRTELKFQRLSPGATGDSRLGASRAD